MTHTAPYTCTDYRTEMILLGLRRRLTAADLGEAERKALRAEIRQLETDMGLEPDANT